VAQKREPLNWKGGRREEKGVCRKDEEGRGEGRGEKQGWQSIERGGRASKGVGVNAGRDSFQRSEAGCSVSSSKQHIDCCGCAARHRKIVSATCSSIDNMRKKEQKCNNGTEKKDASRPGQAGGGGEWTRKEGCNKERNTSTGDLHTQENRTKNTLWPIGNQTEKTNGKCWAGKEGKKREKVIGGKQQREKQRKLPRNAGGFRQKQRILTELFGGLLIPLLAPRKVNTRKW